MLPWEFIALVGLGLVAGSLGGLLGIGGSVVMIPVLTLLLGRDQHVSQAAAMVVNVFVAVPAVRQHHRAGAVSWPVVKRMLPAGLLAIAIGVLVSNELDGRLLMKIFGVFLLYVIATEVHKLLRPRVPLNGAPPTPSRLRVSVVGSITGFAAGLLGIGGGILLVPLLQRICHLALRSAIASSAALMCVTATVGASLKNWELAANSEFGRGAVLDSLIIATCLAPTALIGGSLGARLTHVLPLRWVRAGFLILVVVACFKMLTA